MADEVSAYDVARAFIELHHKLRRTVDEAMTTAGLSFSRAKVLGELADVGPMNQAALAVRLGFAPRSVTDAVDALLRDGLVDRYADPTDRRARIIELTPAGSTALARALKVKLEIFDRTFGTLHPDTRSELAALLTSVGRTIPSATGACYVD
jgi:DNA-binding MarR family transcriptional regulator